MLDLTTLSNDTALNVTTVLEKTRVVANVSGMEHVVDEDHKLGSIARTSNNAWDDVKPSLRSVAKKVLAQLKHDGTVVRAVLLQGTEGRFIEVCPSDKPKELIQELVDEAKVKGLEAIVPEDVEVTLRGPLAQWAIKTMPLLVEKHLLNGNFLVKKRRILVNGFEAVARKIKNEVVTQDLRELLDRLRDGGYNSPAVEVKTKKNG